jgi:lysophospholipase L1-like esterase
MPTTAGGSAPVNVTCNQPAQFPIGSTTVGCTATDARQRTASCSFVVEVKGPPRLRFTRFLAFGDSITAGTESAPVPGLDNLNPWTYSVLLQSRLAARYTLQTVVMLNEGAGGEITSQGLIRLRPVLEQLRPEVLLLMEGTNDLLDGSRGADTAIGNLRLMIGIARALGVQVALATIPPQRPNGLRNRGAVAALIPGFNDRIRALAASEGVVLVDVYAVMNLSMIGVDDLHPTVMGFNVIADTFYEAIVKNFEAPAPSAQMTIR